MGPSTISESRYAILTNPAILAWTHSCCNRGGAMRTRLRALWQYIKRHIFVFVLIYILLFFTLFLFLGYSGNWTGFNGYNQVTITPTISGTHACTVTEAVTPQPGKTLWDWLGLIAILGSVFATGLATSFTVTTQIRATEEQIEANQEQAVVERRLTTLHTYMDKISELLLDENLDMSRPNGNVQKIARVKTLTVLRELNPNNKGLLLRFLNELGLISVNAAKIDLSIADLSRADLHGLDLSNTDLHETILSYANLEGTDLHSATLRRADLKGAVLREADLTEANLSKADLSNAIIEGANLSKAWVTKEQLSKAKSLKGATMPDGSIHDQ